MMTGCSRDDGRGADDVTVLYCSGSGTCTLALKGLTVRCSPWRDTTFVP
jgi:hypothetical protein